MSVDERVGSWKQEREAEWREVERWRGGERYVPRDELDEGRGELDAGAGIEDGGALVALEVGGDDLVLGVAHDALVLGRLGLGLDERLVGGGEGGGGSRDAQGKCGGGGRGEVVVVVHGRLRRWQPSNKTKFCSP